ncbi:MAG: metallophosphoesterase [Oscillospiraceae bacterium]|nr:metallophosphoesterase [Oscillospiraceae bacterium]
MKILTIADQEEKILWDYFRPGQLDDVDLILSAGDLDPRYLSFLVTMAKCPLLYVHGNHDGHYDYTPPEGCFCIEDEIFLWKGIRILGLGGSIRYNPGPHQYSQREMDFRCKKLYWKLKKHKGFDILLTHSPAFGLGDDPSSASHIGFQAFNRLLDQYQPAYMVHGHVHLNYGYQLPRQRSYGPTTVVNACGRWEIQL